MNANRQRLGAALDAAWNEPRRYGRGKEGATAERNARSRAFLRHLTDEGARPVPDYMTPAFLVGMFRVSAAAAKEQMAEAKAARR